MGAPDNKVPGFVGIVKSWIPRRSEPSNLSRDFWMPDQSCRVCYECDSQFTVFNRKHHCRICGRVFCGKCASNSIPAPSGESKDSHDESERIRVCNFCFKQREHGLVLADNEASAAILHLSSSPSARSLASSTSSCTFNSSNSTVGSIAGPYQRPQKNPVPCPDLSYEMNSMKTEHENATSHDNSDPSGPVLDSCLNQVEFFVDSRSDDEYDEYGDYRSDYVESYSQGNDGYHTVTLDEIDHVYGPHEAHDDGENITSNILSCLAPTQDFDALSTDKTFKDVAPNNWNEEEHKPPCEESFEAEPVDFESNGKLWLPPEPEDEEDEKEAVLFDDDDDDEGTTGEWGYLRSSNSFGNREYRTRDKSSEEHRRALKNVVEGHFRALLAQLLEVENLPMIDEGDREGWLDIITSLSWEAATLLKPDTSKGGGMDPGGYVKVKCIPCGRRGESMVVRGVVCKKNVAHRRMTSRIDKPHLLILGGALEYQRVSNQLSSFDTLLQQEMDHLKMAVAKIDSHNPDLLLVEKSVSRHAQEYLLAKDISLVLNIKRPLLERVARCTGAQIVPSIDHLTSPKMGYCEQFHVEKFIEEHVTGQNVKKLTKTLMFFEGCPKPLGCTILLKGADEDELKKVKHVVQYGVFAAYHLALETSFLADEGASLPELHLKTPITVALPDKPSTVDRSISTIPGFTLPISGKPLSSEPTSEAQKPKEDFTGDSTSINIDSTQKLEGIDQIASSESHLYHLDAVPCKPLENFASVDEVPTLESNQLSSDVEETIVQKNQWGFPSNAILEGIDGACAIVGDQNCNRTEMESSKEDFASSSADQQSILVSLSTRCVWKGSVCERAHLFRIKYYGSFDKPLGRFLRDDLFDQDYHCQSCGMPSEAHVHCYTHRQGSLTISVKKLAESLPGEGEGKIWMWHRCLRCPRVGQLPPATRRIVMSDAAWGLSFGKFLELSFSNHAAASRVANCGHSLHRDCLRFYGFGRMVACFRYASINVHSVYLPPPKVEFNYDNQEWIQNVVKEVINRAEVLFTEIQDALRQISEKAVGTGTKDISTGEAKLPFVDLEGILEKRKREFKESVQQMLLNAGKKAGQPAVDILEINKLRRLLLFDSYAWDECLTRAANLIRSKNPEVLSNSSSKLTGRVSSAGKVVDMNIIPEPSKGFNNYESFLQEVKHDMTSSQGENSASIGDTAVVAQEGKEISLDCGKEVDPNRDGKENPVDSQQQFIMFLSESPYPAVSNLSDTLDAAWIGEITARENGSSNLTKVTASENRILAPDSMLLASENKLSSEKGPKNIEHPMRVEMPYPNFYSSLYKNHSFNSQKQGIAENQPVFVSAYRELELQSGARLLLPVGVNDTVVPVYDDEPTSAIAYALVSSDYHAQMSESDKSKDSLDSVGSFSFFDSSNLLSLNALGDLSVDIGRSLGSADEQVSRILEPLKVLHARVSFTDEGPLGKVKYTVTCYYAKRFSSLRRMCCPSEMDFIRSLSRCKKWGAQGGKSNVFFAKTLDERFIIKQVTKTELESFIKFGPAYFKYLSDSTNTKSPTCLAKILGIYQVSLKHLKGGKELKMDVLVMENLLFKRNVTRLYDLKGSSRARYNPDTSGSNKVLLDQNLIEAMPTSPIFVGSKAKRLLERAVWNDTSFLASIDVMDYSLLVGVDEERNELVLGIIDFMRQYTWDKHLETWVKTSGLLGGPKNTAPTVISPAQYKKRFRKAMTTYFLMVPDQWSSPPTIVPGGEKKLEEKGNAQERSGRGVNSS